MSRARWVLFEAPFTSRRARLRGAWHYLVRRYRFEICVDCGRPVGPHTGSWWRADDDLWLRVIGGPSGVMCPPCFTTAARAVGEPIHWVAVPGV